MPFCSSCRDLSRATVEVSCPPNGAVWGATSLRGQTVPVASSDVVGISNLSFAPRFLARCRAAVVLGPQRYDARGVRR
jgi:hypothetical protein